MRVLDRKLIREVSGNAGLLVSVVVVMAVGSGTVVGLGGAHRILEASRSAYYRSNRFADFWINVKRAPRDAVADLSRVTNVASVEPRIVFDVLLDVGDAVRPLTGRLVSIPDDRRETMLNAITLLRGRWFSAERDEEVIISDAFARARGIAIGDRLTLILNRRKESYVVVGTAVSPEYVYMVRGPGDLIPDPESFGVLYVKARHARDVLDFDDACNEFTGRLRVDDAAAVDATLSVLERRLAPYGVLETTPRRRQASHRFLSDEITGLGVTATVMPAIFLVVAALLLNVLMVRLVAQQRTVIGTLKALGYGNGEIVRHYLWLGGLVGVSGGLLGCVLGSLLAYAMVDVYREFFHFPQFHYRLHIDLCVVAVAVSVFFGVVGTLRGVAGVLRLRPAASMQQAPPERGGRIILEAWTSGWRRLGFRNQMALRGLFRNPGKTLTAVFTTSISVAIIFLALVFYQSFLYLVDYEFDRVQHSDVDLALRDESSFEAVREAARLPDAGMVEAAFGLRCRLENGLRERRMVIVGLAPKRLLLTPMDEAGRPIDIPDRGLVLSRKLATLLGVRQGDTLWLTPSRGRQETRRVKVASIVRSFVGMSAYASLDFLSEVAGESLAINSVRLTLEAPSDRSFFKEVKELPEVQGVALRREAKQNIEETVIKTSVFSIGMMIVLAGVIAFGGTLNQAQVEISDRRREVSTLRVLGYTPVQVAGIFLRQTGLTFAIGVAVSLPLGYAMVVALAQAYDSELYRIPVVIRPAAIGQTIGLAWIFFAVAQAVAYLRIRRMNWLDGAKVRD